MSMWRAARFLAQILRAYLGQSQAPAAQTKGIHNMMTLAMGCMESPGVLVSSTKLSKNRNDNSTIALIDVVGLLEITGRVLNVGETAR